MVEFVARPLVAMLLSPIVSACNPVTQDLDHSATSLFRWTVVDRDSEIALTAGCAFSGVDHSNRIKVHAAPGAHLAETITWEDVTKESSAVLPENDEAYWCADQGSVQTKRVASLYSGLNCLKASDPDPPAVVESISLVNEQSQLASGRTLALLIVRTGTLNLTFDVPCDPEWAHDGGPTAPVWAELTMEP